MGHNDLPALRDRLISGEAATFEDIDFTGLALDDLYLEDKTFLRCNFSGCRLRFVDLTDCRFQRCRLTSTDMSYGRFDGVSFEDGCEAVGIQLVDTTVNILRIHDSKFSGANLRDMRASGLSLDRSIFAHADMAGVSLSGQKITKLIAPGAIWDTCDLRNTRWIDCVLTDGTYTDAKMRGADMSGSDIGLPNVADILGPMKGMKISLSQAADFATALGYKVV